MHQAGGVGGPGEEAWRRSTGPSTGGVHHLPGEIGDLSRERVDVGQRDLHVYVRLICHRLQSNS